MVSIQLGLVVDEAFVIGGRDGWGGEENISAWYDRCFDRN